MISTNSSMFTLITFELWPNQTSILSLVYLKGVGVYCVQNILHSPKQKQWNSFKRKMDPQKVLLICYIRAFLTCLYIVNRSCNNSGHFVMMSILTYVMGTFDLCLQRKFKSHDDEKQVLQTTWNHHHWPIYPHHLFYIRHQSLSIPTQFTNEFYNLFCELCESMIMLRHCKSNWKSNMS